MDESSPNAERKDVTTVSLLFSGAGRPLQEAQANLAHLEQRHSQGEHFWRWTGRVADGRNVLGCMLCALRTVEVSAVDSSAA
jgi:hypothetical protein